MLRHVMFYYDLGRKRPHMVVDSCFFMSLSLVFVSTFDAQAFEGPALDASTIVGPAFEASAFQGPACQGPGFAASAFEASAVSGASPQGGSGKNIETEP